MAADFGRDAASFREADAIAALPGLRRPHWLGYTLGRAVVADFFTAHPGATAFALAKEPAIAFKPHLARLAWP